MIPLAPTFVQVTIGRCEAMAVGTKEPKVSQLVIMRIAVNMVKGNVLEPVRGFFSDHPRCWPPGPLQTQALPIQDLIQ
jgi:hypothetical protein